MYVFSFVCSRLTSLVSLNHPGFKPSHLCATWTHWLYDSQLCPRGKSYNSTVMQYSKQLSCWSTKQSFPQCILKKPPLWLLQREKIQTQPVSECIWWQSKRAETEVGATEEQTSALLQSPGWKRFLWIHNRDPAGITCQKIHSAVETKSPS